MLKLFQVSYYQSEVGKICIGLSIFSSTVGFESPCSSSSELVISGKETKRLSGSRVIWCICFALSGHLSGLALA